MGACARAGEWELALPLASGPTKPCEALNRVLQGCKKDDHKGYYEGYHKGYYKGYHKGYHEGYYKA